MVSAHTCDDPGVSLMMAARRWPERLLSKYVIRLSFPPLFFFGLLQRGLMGSLHFGSGPACSRRLREQLIGEESQQLQRGSDKHRSYEKLIVL